MGQWVGWVMGQWVNGSWVSDTMGQMGHGSPMVTHGPLWRNVAHIVLCGARGLLLDGRLGNVWPLYQELL